MTVKVDFGCGIGKQDGYLGLDFDLSYKPDILCDIEHLPLKDNCVDEAVCFHTLEHTSNPHQFLVEAWRTLKPNAIFTIKVPYYTSYIAHKTTHLRQVTEDDLRDHTTNNPLYPFFKRRFTIEEIDYEYFPDVKIELGKLGISMDFARKHLWNVVCEMTVKMRALAS